MKTIPHFLELEEDALVLDIGSGTQDVLYARAHTNVENWIRFVLPSPAKLVAQKIEKCTATKTPILLTGTNMGGGFFKAIKAHIDAKIPVMATTKAVLSLYDDIDKAKSLGIEIVEENVENQKIESHEVQCITLADFSHEFWTYFLDPLGLQIPKTILIAAQDHGVHVKTSNRIGRFQLWKDLIAKSQNPSDWLFHEVPTSYTRLQALKESANARFVADTGTAALLGALSMPEIRARSEREGVTIVNLGNSHVLAFLVYQSKVYGIYEHHSGMHSTDSLLKDLEEFRLSWLPDEEVRKSGGHGSLFYNIPAEAEGFRPTYILGPRRALLEGHGQFIAPQSDMMLAGAYGLLYGFNTMNKF